jgi:hypothetical protein
VKTVTKAELLDENDALLNLLADIEREVGTELSDELSGRLNEFLENDEDEGDELN